MALRLAGDAVDAAHMRRAAELVRAHGGLERARVFTRFWMALFGLWSWDDLPALPPEVIFLPPWFPLNIYDFGCWARQTIVPLTVVASHRPVRRLAFNIDELRTGVMPPPPSDSLSTWAGRFQLLDRALHFYERRPFRWLRRTALRVAAEWILRRQEHDGGWGGIQPPWVYSIMALHLLGYPLDHPALAKALKGLDGFTLDPNGRRRLEACQSPVWDTALALVGLNDAGVAKDQPNLVRAIDWILREEIRVPGDWAVRRPKLEPGGWAFEFANDNYPDIDDTAEVVLALRGASAPGARADVDAAIRRGVAWTLGMQSSNDGWAAFDVDNTSRLCAELPFCDFGEVTDPPSADVTAHVLEMLALEGQAGTDAARRGRAWLLREQETDGSWFGRWGANYVYGTGAALPALVGCGVPTTRRVGAARGGVARGEAEPRRRLGRGPPLLRRPRLGRPRQVDRVADRLGAAGPARRGRAQSRARARRTLAGGEPAGRRRLGRARVHRHRLPGRLLHPLPHVPDRVPADGARALRAERRAVNTEPLVVVAPLWIEARALRPALPGVRIARSGMGPRRAQAATRALASQPAPRALAVAGVCGALDPRLVPGDVVVASELRGNGAPIALDCAKPLARALEARGITVHVGPILCRRAARRRPRPRGARRDRRDRGRHGVRLARAAPRALELRGAARRLGRPGPRALPPVHPRQRNSRAARTSRRGACTDHLGPSP